MKFFRLMGLAGALTACAYAAAVQPAGAASTMDHLFVMTAAQGGIAEVADGRLALTKTSNEAVRAIALRMIRDHSKANARLAAIATGEGMTVPTAPDAADQAAMARQRRLSGAAFESAYLENQQTAHVQTIALFKREIGSSTDRQLVGFARTTLPTIQEHLTMIRGALRSR